MVSAYFPNGQEPGSDKFDYKMHWLDALRDWVRAELAGTPQAGADGRLQHHLRRRRCLGPGGPEETPSTAPMEERYALAGPDRAGPARRATACSSSPRKAIRWWDYRDSASRRNRGLRIDHILVSDALKPRVTACAIDKAPAQERAPQRPRAGGASNCADRGLLQASSWILRVMVLRPMPSFWAASMRRPRVLASAVWIRRDSKRRVSTSHTSVRPAGQQGLASASRPASQASSPARHREPRASGSGGRASALRRLPARWRPAGAGRFWHRRRSHRAGAPPAAPMPAMASTSGGRSLGSITCAGAITVSQWQMFSSWRTLPGKSKLPEPGAAPRRRCAWARRPAARALCCRKWRVSMGMSSRRSRSAGRRRRITLRRWNRSSRNTPSLTRCSRFWWVAAITRTLALTALWPPTR